MAGPLSNIRVLDLSRVLAGPWCTQILADLGAEVIKIERPQVGDETRHWGPPWLKDSDNNNTRESAYYISANRGKHSVTVDISQPQGQEIIRQLAAKSDVLIENFKTGGLAQKGLAYEDISEVKPDIIYCSITGFGQTGPLAHEAGYDYMIQAMGGLMSITGIADGNPGAGPQRTGVAISDLTTGMYSSIAILSALHYRSVTGEGQYIDMALLDTQVSWLANQGLNYFIGKQCPQRTGEYHPNLVPYQPFESKDGYIVIAVGNDAQFQRFCREAGCEYLCGDERYSTNPQRVENRKSLVAVLEPLIQKRTTDTWIQALHKISVPCGPINDIKEVFREPQVQHRGMQIELDHPLSGKVPGIANPIRFSKTPIEYNKAPPLLGEDSIHVMRNILQKSDEEIAELQVNGVL